MMNALNEIPSIDRVGLVAVGASSGGIGALREILSLLPGPLRVPVVVVVHLHPALPSLLPEVLAPASSMPVRAVDGPVGLEAGTVYVASPGRHLVVEEAGQAGHSDEPPVHYSRPSIDVLFRAVARSYGASALGILLTGANEDGAEGLAAIAAAGGVTWVQDPEEAEAKAMPTAALRRFSPDRVLPLRGIAELLGGLSQTTGGRI